MSSVRPCRSSARSALAPLARLAPAAACARTLHQDAARRTESGVVGATMRMRARQVAKEAEELEEEEQEDVTGEQTIELATRRDFPIEQLKIFFFGNLLRLEE
jgi:hypothetical protein